MAKPNVISKQELLEAQKCVAEKGMDKLTLKAVADQANVSQERSITISNQRAINN